MIHSQRLYHSQWSSIRCFLEFLCFFYDPLDVNNLISGSSPFSKFSFYIWKFSLNILLKPSLKDFEHQLASMWNKYNCTVIWTFFGIAFLWDWNENWPFPVLCLLMSFPKFLAYWTLEILGVTSKFGFGLQNEAGQSLTEFLKTMHWSWQTPSSNNTRETSTHGYHQMVNTKIRLIIFFATKDGEALYSQQKQDLELTVAQIMNSLLQNSDLNWRK